MTNSPAIYAALAAVMADVDHVAKRDRNTAQNFVFRGIDAVVNAVGPVLRKHQVIVVPHLDSAVYETVPLRNGGTATSCRVQVTYRFLAVDGSCVEASVAAEAFDVGDKATPKAMSVAFRTALLQALALPTDEPDPDTQSYERGTAMTEEQVVAQDAANARAELGRWLTQEGIDPQEAVDRWVVDHPGEHIKDSTDGPGIRALRARWAKEIEQQRGAA